MDSKGKRNEKFNYFENININNIQTTTKYYMKQNGHQHKANTDLTRQAILKNQAIPIN
jgi:hypothetical protein